MVEMLSGKRVIVSAAAGGAGLRIAQRFLQCGAKVAICDLDPDRVSRAASDNPGLLALVCDLSNVEATRRFAQRAINELGGLDVLVNNAGIAGPTAPPEDISDGQWQETLAVNVTSHFILAQEALVPMKKANGGVIINISSTAAFVGRPHRLPYQTSKYAVIGLTKSLAKDVGRFNIRVNSICPGAIVGERIAGVIAREASVRGQTIESVEKLYKSASSLGTFNTADDIADMILYLSGTSGERISGHVMCVDSDML